MSDLDPRVLAFPFSGKAPRRRARRVEPVTTDKVIGRGVYTSHWRGAGQALLVAVTSSGDRIAEVAVAAERDESAVTTALHDLLDAVDPLPAVAPLTLVH